MAVFDRTRLLEVLSRLVAVCATLEHWYRGAAALFTVLLPLRQCGPVRLLSSHIASFRCSGVCACAFQLQLPSARLFHAASPLATNLEVGVKHRAPLSL